jgi:hypothetical protein
LGQAAAVGPGLPQHHIENSALKSDFSGRSRVVDLLISLEGGLCISRNTKHHLANIEKSELDIGLKTSQNTKHGYAFWR